MRVLTINIVDPAMTIYQTDYSQADVFTYEIGKYFDWIDHWDYYNGTLTIRYSGAEPNLQHLTNRITTLCSWQREAAE